MHTRGVIWRETDKGLRAPAVAARVVGRDTLLKPHLWLIEEVPDQWRGSISFSTEKQWLQWKSDYRTFILHYAELAQQAQAEDFSVGVKLRSAVLAQPEFWSLLISEVRETYSGKLACGASWYREYLEVPFWDQLDFIGIHAYFPLTNSLDASIADLERGWRPHLEENRQPTPQIRKVCTVYRNRLSQHLRRRRQRLHPAEQACRADG